MQKVGLFVTCLADVMRPAVAVAALRLLRDAGAKVHYPPAQTCCGQIAFSSGYDDEARALVQKCADEFADCEKVVMPSGSCCGMLRTKLGDLFAADSAERAFGGKCMELSEYLAQCGYAPKAHPQPFTATFHDSCAGLRELGIKHAPRRLLQQAGIRIAEMAESEECCGFGGRFSTQFGELSTAMADRKCMHIAASGTSGATAVIGGDIGCLLNMEGRLRRLQNPLPVLHWAEVLAAGIAEARAETGA